MIPRVFFAFTFLTLSVISAGPNNNLYDRNRQDANCDESGCNLRRPPYYMPKGYVVNPSDEENDEEVAGLDDDIQETETGSSQRLIF